MLVLISKVCLGDETDSLEEEYQSIGKSEFTITWDYSILNNWLDSTNLSRSDERHIEDIIDFHKEHTEG